MKLNPFLNYLLLLFAFCILAKASDDLAPTIITGKNLLTEQTIKINTAHKSKKGTVIIFIANQLKAYKTPHSFLIAPNGRILYQGGITDSEESVIAKKNFLAVALDEVQNNQKVSTPKARKARTLGCIISREENNFE